jgi:hypothetical protein
MSFDPSNSAIRVDASLEEKLQGATHEQIKELLKDAAVEQHLAVREWDESILTPTALAGAPRPQKFARAVIIDGHKHIVEADSGLALEKSVGDLYRSAMQPAATTQQTTEQPRNERGQFVSAENVATKIELELAFKRGDITASDYIQRSGAVAEYLEKSGVPLEDLKASVADKQYERSWAEATQEFLAGPGNDWPGGSRNLEIAGLLIKENGLTGKPSVETLSKVWAFMKENNLAVKNPDPAAATAVASAKSVEEIREAFGGRSSSMFGR